MANSKLKLYYFDGRGRAEVARIILAAAGKEFEDIRFVSADWPKYKPLTPYGLVPTLDVDGVVYAQSTAIYNFLAREFGFYGSSSLEIFKIDEIVQLFNDFVNPAVDAKFYTDDPVAKEAAFKRVKEELVPKTLGFLEDILKKNGTGYFVGKKPSLVEFLVLDSTTGGTFESFLDISNYPLIKKNVELMRSNANIAKYLAARKETPW